MANPVTFRIEGLRETEKALAELSKAAARSQGRKALQAGGEVLAKRARELVPKDKGHMAESIDVSGTLTRTQKAQHRKQADIERFVGPNDPGAVAQEFGTYFHPPQPFMRPAWDQTHGEVLKRISDHLMVGVSQAVARARRKVARVA